MKSGLPTPKNIKVLRTPQKSGKLVSLVDSYLLSLGILRLDIQAMLHP